MLFNRSELLIIATNDTNTQPIYGCWDSANYSLIWTILCKAVTNNTMKAYISLPYLPMNIQINSPALSRPNPSNELPRDEQYPSLVQSSAVISNWVHQHRTFLGSRLRYGTDMASPSSHCIPCLTKRPNLLNSNRHVQGFNRYDIPVLVYACQSPCQFLGIMYGLDFEEV